MREDVLTSILTQLNGTSADIEASGIISTDGLMMASVLPAGMDEDRVGAMSFGLDLSDPATYDGALDEAWEAIHRAVEADGGRRPAQS